MKLLSIIVPFHNSAKKCERLLETLSNCADDSVELILVDDGSGDDTLDILQNFKRNAHCSVTIISQENKGPGGARNAGLDVAKGTYLWLVDSDDNIDLDAALFLLKENIIKDPDFIDFNIFSRGSRFSSMELPSGLYSSGERLFKNFGRIFSKIFHSRLFNRCNIRYPEFCIYEDNALLFILPHFVDRFVVSDICAYVHQEEYFSVTRGKQSDRYFDRMLTACWGYSFGAGMSQNITIKKAMDDKFVGLYLVNTGGLSRVPSVKWLEKMRVMRKFREDSILMGVGASTRRVKEVLEERGVSKKFKFVFVMLYLFSRCMPSQRSYFEKKRMSAWGRPFSPPNIVPVRIE
ncbi:glycosyltransferase family 2 protein [Halomonas sp.]|uniref:glycosyltransferase family 2 protein n=1 Tax=Halomonas sp. TaxID=1486246 RepID=UPI0035653F36